MNDHPNGHHTTSPFGDTTLPQKTGLSPEGLGSPLPVGARVVAVRVTEYDADRRPVTWDRLVGRVIRVLGVAARGHAGRLHYWYVVQGEGNTWLVPDRHILAHSVTEDAPTES